jgi:8-oxo-dGTP pyrophosphatase MutT (NUDIX family)
MDKPVIKLGTDVIGTGVIYFCHDGQGRFLMSKRGVNARDEHGRWDIGGGAIEFGERISEAIRREVREEYCTDVLSYDFLGFRNSLRPYKGQLTHWIVMDHIVMIDPSKVANGEPHKFDDVQWFSFDNFPPLEQTHSEFPKFLDRYGERLRKELITVDVLS